jgi:NitT/TauT family transport system substrate-binding protein
MAAQSAGMRFAFRELCCAAAVALIAVPGVSAVAQTSPLPLIHLTVGMTPTADAGPVLYAVQSGMFRRAGLDVDVQKISSGAATAAAIAGGTFQFGSVSAISAINAVAKGVPLQMVVPSGLYNGTTDFVATVVKSNSTLVPGPQFNGHTIGSVAIDDLNTISMLEWLRQHGADTKSIKVLEIPYSTLVPAIDEGRIDMATLIQPGLALGLATGKVKMLGKAYDALAPRFYITTWMGKSDWIAANPDVTRTFARVIRDAEIYANAHQDEIAQLIAPFSGIDVNVMLHGGHDTYAASYVDPANVQPIIDALVKYGTVDHPIDAHDLIAPAVRGMK